MLKHAPSSCSSGRTVQRPEVSLAHLTQPLSLAHKQVPTINRDLLQVFQNISYYQGTLLPALQKKKKSSGSRGPKPNTSGCSSLTSQVRRAPQMCLQTIHTPIYDCQPPGLLEGRAQLHARAINQKSDIGHLAWHGGSGGTWTLPTW